MRLFVILALLDCAGWIRSGGRLLVLCCGASLLFFLLRVKRQCRILAALSCHAESLRLHELKFLCGSAYFLRDCPLLCRCLRAACPESDRVALLLVYEDRQVVVLHEGEDPVWELALRDLTELLFLVNCTGPSFSLRVLPAVRGPGSTRAHPQAVPQKSLSLDRIDTMCRIDS